MGEKSYPINGKLIFAFNSKDEFLNFISNRKSILIALNAEKLNKSDIKLDHIINNNVGYADGIGAVMALRRKGIHSIKIAGAEFWLDIVERFSGSKSFYLVGSTTEVIERTYLKLKTEFPDLEIKGHRNGFLNEKDKENLVLDLVDKKPDVVFVAQGSPRQEFLMAELIKHHEALYMGLGGSFDVYAGTKRRAPVFYQKLGMEWFYRLLKEPTRISRQTSLLKFLIKIIFGKI